MGTKVSHILKRRFEDFVITNLPEWLQGDDEVKHWDLKVDSEDNISLFVNLDRDDGTHVAGDRAFYMTGIVKKADHEADMYSKSNFGPVDSRYGFFPTIRFLAESPAGFADDQAELYHTMFHIIRGVFGGKGTAYFTAHDTVPTIEGMLGAGASTDLSALDKLDLAPAPRAVVGGA